MIEPLKLEGFVVLGIYLLSSLWLFLNALVQLHLLWHYKKGKKIIEQKTVLPPALPFVSVQIPLYNEKYVIERLLEALAGLS